jgi:hypothetical protein
MVSRTVTALAATLLAAVAQLLAMAPALVAGRLDLARSTFPLVAGGLTVGALVVGPVGAALLGTRLDAALPANRWGTLGLFALAATVGYLAATVGYLVVAPDASTAQPLWSVAATVALRAVGFVVPFALAGFAGAAYAHLGSRGDGRRHSHSLGGDGR